jgi:hypothetical protein
MSLTNRVSLIGFLGKDAEIKTTRGNARLVVLSVATKRSWKDRQTGEWQSKTTRHRVICWGGLVDIRRRSRPFGMRRCGEQVFGTFACTTYDRRTQPGSAQGASPMSL